jgi:hypothetical protein
MTTHGRIQPTLDHPSVRGLAAATAGYVFVPLSALALSSHYAVVAIGAMPLAY